MAVTVNSDLIAAIIHAAHVQGATVETITRLSKIEPEVIERILDQAAEAESEAKHRESPKSNQRSHRRLAPHLMRAKPTSGRAPEHISDAVEAK